MKSVENFRLRFGQIKKLRKRFLEIAKNAGTPTYVYDEKEVKNNLGMFRKAFGSVGQNVKVFYAIKSNYYPGLLKTIVEEGSFLDASSTRELELALDAGAGKIIYTGPGKTEKDFALILQNAGKITVNLESFRELRLLAKMAAMEKKIVRCGLRVVTKSQDGWTKFGLSLEQLKGFFNEASKYPSINFCGVHFHISMNQTPAPYIKTLKELQIYFKNSFSREERAKFEYIDIGGGFYPAPFEGIYSWNPDQVMKFFSNEEHFEKIIKDRMPRRYIPIKVAPIEEFGEKIAEAYKEVILPTLPNVDLYCEPGRFISHSAMHILLTLVDIKSEHMGIADGGNNIIGWEKYQFFNYAPLFNLTNFDITREQPFILYGSLCTPDDIWGYYLYGKKIQEGDVILMPFQGAYTYTLAQQFIRDIPKVVDLY